MDPITQQAVLAAAGAAGGDPVYVDDVFSTFLYEGDAVGGADTQTINNGIDLAGEGGLVWIKNRNTSSREHILTDTERGATKYISSNQTSGESTGSNHLNLFNNNGFRVGSDSTVNENTKDFVSWTFRKAPGFFDVITFTGNGSNQSIAHNLGSVPGCIMFKNTSTADHWVVYHRGISVPAEKALILNETWTEDDDTYFNDTAPTSTHFTVGPKAQTNGNGNTIVAYVFAHDDAQFGTDEDESIVKCGTYTGTGAANNTVNLGFEPQWVMLKSTSSGNAQPWFMLDNMRGAPTGGDTAYIFANDASAEATFGIITFNATGFAIEATGAGTNGSGQNYIYMAIRRPNKPPEVGTDVFAVNLVANDSVFVTTGFPVDFGWQKTTGSTWDNFSFSRLQGPGTLLTFNSNAAGSEFGPGPDFDSNTQMQGTRGIGNLQEILYGFKRAPGFFDLVIYPGTGSATGINHNLGVVPELMLVKCRSHGDSWMVYVNGVGPTETLVLNNENAASVFSNRWNGAPTSSVINVSTDTSVNYSGRTYVAYLFATLSNISKVGSYSGTGSANNIDCGFTAGARFVLIKRTDSSGDWYYWDTVRGIISGNDPYLLLNSTAVQVTNTDYIDPLNAGFTVTSSAPAALNASGGTYIFLAIA